MTCPTQQTDTGSEWLDGELNTAFSSKGDYEARTKRSLGHSATRFVCDCKRSKYANSKQMEKQAWWKVGETKQQAQYGSQLY